MQKRLEYRKSEQAQEIRRFRHSRVRPQGMGRRLPPIAPHRCDLRTRRRPRSYAAPLHDGAARKADSIAAPFSSQGPNVDVAPELLGRMAERVVRDHESPTRLAERP